MVLSESLVFFSGELVLLGCGWVDVCVCGGGVLTSVGHHDFLYWSILALWGRVGKAGKKTCPPHSQQAEAALDYSVSKHPERKRKKLFRLQNVSGHLKLDRTAISEGQRQKYYRWKHTNQDMSEFSQTHTKNY